MISTHAILPWLLLAAATASSSSVPLVCRLDALTASERERHRLLAETLQRAIVGTSELPDGYEVSVDLARVPGTSRSRPLVQVAQWVDLESRCCPFLDFEISLPGKGRIARLRLTGGQGIKAFLAAEFPPFTRGH